MSQSNQRNEINILFSGYSDMINDTTMLANCTCTLIQGKNTKIIVDTRTAWDADEIIAELKKYALEPSDITHVICTHGHSDHIGCNYLFLQAKEHIVCHAISNKNEYRSIDDEVDYVIDDGIRITATPGHTLDSISVIVENNSLAKGVVAICGDLFEKSDDCVNPQLWIEAGSDSIEKQRTHRHRMAELADIIVPGHGNYFKVTPEIRNNLEKELNL